MSLFKRGNVWWAYFYIDGARQQHSTGTSSKRQAETIAQKLKEESNARRHQVVQIDPDMTFAALASRFLASGSARPHHTYHLKFLLPFFGETPACRITKAQAADFRKARRQGNPRIKDASINRDLSVLRHILYWATDESLLAANPVARLKMERERRTRRHVLALGEEDRLYVTRSKTPEGEAREIPLTERLWKMLSENQRSEGLVFQYREEPVHIIKRSWKTALKNAGLRHIRFHDLRHTFNTRLLEAGVMQEVRMALMGHSTGRSVHATYTHIELPIKREALCKLEAWVNQQRSQTQLQGGSNASQTP